IASVNTNNNDATLTASSGNLTGIGISLTSGNLTLSASGNIGATNAALSYTSSGGLTATSHGIANITAITGMVVLGVNTNNNAATLTASCGNITGCGIALTSGALTLSASGNLGSTSTALSYTSTGGVTATSHGIANITA